MANETPSVVIIGDGPTGLSAALFLAKNGVPVTVLGYDETPLQKALLRNYLGVEELQGPDYLQRARQQVEAFGGTLRKEWVERIDLGPPLSVETSAGPLVADFLVLATGFDRDVAAGLDLATTDGGLVRVDADGKTSHERVYAGGSLVRGAKTQVATSVGDGAAIALDILSEMKGKPFHDFDVLKPAQQAPPRTR